MLTRIAHAKINLALHVTGQRSDGYHLLDSIVGFAEFGDKISIKPSSDKINKTVLEITGPFGPDLSTGDDNLILKAASLFAERTGKGAFPVHIELEKNLPISSGIGGGSADAAATLLLLKEIWQSEISPFEVASQLGADVAMCLYSKPLRANGIGDEITLLPEIEPMHLVLVNPNIGVSTPKIFNTLSFKDNPRIVENLISDMRNDLQTPAIRIAPVISDVLNALGDCKPLFSRMSGSGATCFGIFETEDQANTARTKILKAYPDWWGVATKTLGS